MKEQDTRIGIVMEEPDLNGFFTIRNSWNDKEELCCVTSYNDAPSLYRGGLKLYA